MITVRRSQERGVANFGWLNSRHTFSFGSYYDPEYMGVSTLRVINDDIVDPGAGFATHGHRDMEIISLVLEGAIEHKDSEGNIQTLPAGEFQLMSAGSGIMHSEYNASQQDPLRFLQIWVVPNVKGQKPGYQQKDFGQQPGITPIATPDGTDGTLHIKSDTRLSQLILEPGSEVDFNLDKGRNGYVHNVSSELQVTTKGDLQSLSGGDGATIEAKTNELADKNTINFKNTGSEKVMALIFDLPA